MEKLQISRQPNGSLAVQPSDSGVFHCWERPRVGCRYLVSVRGGGAPKLVAGKRDRERSVIVVFRKWHRLEPDDILIPTRLVARLAPPALLDPTPLAELVCIFADWYGDALSFVEVKDGPMLAKECQRLGVGVNVREVIDKHTSQFTKEIGWETDDETGPAALNALVNAVREAASGGDGRVLIECPRALSELETFTAESDAPLVSHDDDVRAIATALYNIDSATLLRPESRARRAPDDGWKVVERW